MTKGIGPGCGALLAATPAQAPAKVTRGLYDYSSFSTSVGTTTYQAPVSLTKRGRYSRPPDATGSVTNPPCETYRQGGGEIDFASGPWADLYGLEKATTTFDVWAEGEQVKSWTCYFKS